MSRDLTPPMPHAWAPPGWTVHLAFAGGRTAIVATERAEVAPQSEAAIVHGDSAQAYMAALVATCALAWSAHRTMTAGMQALRDAVARRRRGT